MSCSSLPKPDIKNLATRAALKVAQPALEKVFLSEAPILPPSRSQYPILDQLPGMQFKPEWKQHSISFDPNGNLLLASGDYSFPVMTYCMKETGASPAGYTYVLASMQGKRAKIIREVNAKASEIYSAEEIQFLSWSLQAGLSYDELSAKNQTILNAINPTLKEELKESFLKLFQKEWDVIASKSVGLLPDFDEASDEFLDELGEIGQSIKNLRVFRNEIRNGSDLRELRSRIDTTAVMKPPILITPWSQISGRVYARFITKKGFLEVGQIQVRVLHASSKRAPSSNVNDRVSLDLHALIADPRNLNIQPLSISLILWPRGMIGAAVMVKSPVILAALLATILATQSIDWEAFLKLRDLIESPTDPKLKKIIEEGNKILNEELDKLEKPLRDLKIIDRKTKNTSSSKGQQARTREYTKEGGDEELQKDFDKLPDKTSKTSDGFDKKELQDGATVVKRPKEGDNPPALETQSIKGAAGEKGHFYIKVRYIK